MLDPKSARTVLVAILATYCALFFTSGKAAADNFTFTVCNYSGRDLTFAIWHFFEDRNGYRWKGWWSVPSSRSCFNFGQFPSAEFGYYAEDKNGKPVYGGNMPLCVTHVDWTPDELGYLKQTDCSQGFYIANFSKLEPPNDNDYTLVIAPQAGDRKPFPAGNYARPLPRMDEAITKRINADLTKRCGKLSRILAVGDDHKSLCGSIGRQCVWVCKDDGTSGSCDDSTDNGSVAFCH